MNEGTNNSTTRYVFGTWWPDDRPLTVDEADSILRLAHERRADSADYPLDKLLALFGRLAAAWSDRQNPYRAAALARLPAETGFSQPMIELGLDHLSTLFDPAWLERKMMTELRGMPRGSGVHYDHRSFTSLRWEPLGVLLHVLSGNVFLGGAGSLVEGLLTGNVTILKMSSAERVFLPLLIRSIEELDEDGVVPRSLALIDYPSTSSEVVERFKHGVNGIVVWGGEEAVRGYRDGLPASTRMIVFGPKISTALVTRRGVATKSIDGIARLLAREVAIWDQHACTAPQSCYVEGAEEAARLVEALNIALAAEHDRLPAGGPDTARACEIRKLRTVAELNEALGVGLLRGSTADLAWTITLSSDPRLEPSPLQRTLSVIAVDDRKAVLPQLEALRGYVQTVGLAAAADEVEALAGQLAAVGVQRIVDIGLQAGGEIDDPHDGQYDLPQFLNLVITRCRPARPDHHPLDTMDPDRRLTLINERLRRLITVAKRAPHYAALLHDVTIDGVDDLPRLPVLDRATMDAGMPPGGIGLATSSELQGGYVSRSGGSTGKPKLSIYDGHDWEHMIETAVRLFRSMGFVPGDVVANCMMAGDLYGSFVSFDHINCRVGVTTLAFAGNLRPDVFLEMWKTCRINVVQGVPTLFIPVLKAVHAIEPTLRLDRIMFAGTPMGMADRRWLEDTLQVSRIASVIGANDGGQIAWQCEEQRGGFHHTVDDFNYLEIVDDEGRPLPDGEGGRMLITSLLKYAYPLIRYDIGDRARFVPEPCACGRTNRVIEFLGRGDDIVSVGVINIDGGDVRRALEELPISELQVAACTEDAGEYLAVRIETEHEISPDRVRELLRERISLLAERLKSGILLRVQVSFHRLGELPRNPRTGKLRLVVDER